MLHGFWGDTGQPGSGTEFMGYIPNSLFSNAAGEGLHALTEQGYVHRYYVDQTPAVSDAYVATDTAGVATWRTILLGSLRGGGKVWKLAAEAKVGDEIACTCEVMAMIDVPKDA